MKKLILTSAFILGSIVTLFAQANRPGNPIGGIIVKGDITALPLLMAIRLIIHQVIRHKTQ
jgi:hypothetical protein